MFGIILINECDRHPHRLVPVARDVGGLGDFDRVVVVVLRVGFGRIPLPEEQLLVAFREVEVGEPADVAHAPPLLPVRVDPEVRRLRFVVVGHLEPEVARLVTEPDPVRLDKRKDFAIGDGVHVANDEEALAVFHQEGHVLAEKRERRVRHDDVGLVEERNAFGRAEVAVTREPRQHVLPVADEPFNVGKVDAPVLVLVPHLGDDDLVGLMPTRSVRAPPRLHDRPVPEEVELCADDGGGRVAGRRQALQTQYIEVHREVLEEIALVGVVAVAQDARAPEVGSVVLQLVLDERKVRVELVLLVLRGIV